MNLDEYEIEAAERLGKLTAQLIITRCELSAALSVDDDAYLRERVAEVVAELSKDFPPAIHALTPLDTPEAAAAAKLGHTIYTETRAVAR